jgi:hypothetical protein
LSALCGIIGHLLHERISSFRKSTLHKEILENATRQCPRLNDQAHFK